METLASWPDTDTHTQIHRFLPCRLPMRRHSSSEQKPPGRPRGATPAMSRRASSVLSVSNLRTFSISGLGLWDRVQGIVEESLLRRMKVAVGIKTRNWEQWIVGCRKISAKQVDEGGSINANEMHHHYPGIGVYVFVGCCLSFSYGLGS